MYFKIEMFTDVLSRTLANRLSFFQALNHFLSGKLLKNKDSPKQVFQKLLASRTSDFYQTGILKLVSRWEKCIQSKENYFD